MGGYSYMKMIRSPGDLQDKCGDDKICSAGVQMGNTFKYFDLILHGSSNVSKHGCTGMTLDECSKQQDVNAAKLLNIAAPKIKSIPMEGRQELGDQYIKKSGRKCKMGGNEVEMDLFVNNRPGNTQNSPFNYGKKKGGMRRGRGLIPNMIEQLIKINPVDALVKMGESMPTCERYCVKEIKVDNNQLTETYRKAILDVNQANNMNDVNFKGSSRKFPSETETTCDGTPVVQSATMKQSTIPHSGQNGFQTMNQSFEDRDYLIMSQKVLVGGIFFYLFYKLFKKK
tara:strand:- start:1263 stop:2114 length:852 start_codon:yes stop_codon:yes gene_type:complete